MITRVLNFIERKFFQKFFFKKICQIGHSHLLNYRSKYRYVTNLNDLDYKIFSQNGEDGIIDYLLFQLRIDKPKYVEIGVGDYNECNTRFIFETSNSKGLIIDCIKNLKKKVTGNIIFWKGDLTIVEEFVNHKNINSLLIENKFNENVDLFSLDIDGVDYWILKELPNKFTKIAVLEFNPTFGPQLEITVPNIKNFNRTKYHYSNLCFGAYLKAIINLMKSKGFVFMGVNKNCINAFFINIDEIKNLNLKIPDDKNLSSFTNSNYRESRSIKGNLTFLTGINKINEISECEIINLANQKNEKIKIKELL